MVLAVGALRPEVGSWSLTGTAIARVQRAADGVTAADLVTVFLPFGFDVSPGFPGIPAKA